MGAKDDSRSRRSALVCALLDLLDPAIYLIDTRRGIHCLSSRAARYPRRDSLRLQALLERHGPLVGPIASYRCSRFQRVFFSVCWSLLHISIMRSLVLPLFRPVTCHFRFHKTRWHGPFLLMLVIYPLPLCSWL
jgi:hypothetical protein